MIQTLLHRFEPPHIVRLIAIALFIAVFAGSWDAWWHGFLGRESFWSPPHVLLYASVLVAIASGVYGWWRFRDKSWKRLGLVLLLVPLSAPFDELWHRMFGVEEITSVIVLWSPPHLVLIFSILSAVVLLLPLLKKHLSSEEQRLFGSIVFATGFSLLSLLVTPFEPVGLWRVLGFFGAGVVSFVLSITLGFARAWLPGMGRATIVAFPILAIIGIGFSESMQGAVVDFAPHAHPPAWLVILSILLPALFLDLKKRVSIVSITLASLLHAVVLYGFATYFIEPAFQYGFSAVAIALVTSIAGGLCAGFAVMMLREKNRDRSL